MGFEQPTFEPESAPEERETAPQEGEPSNVIEGPWPEREPETVEDATELAPREPVSEPSNVIEGPWPKREAEPMETPPEPLEAPSEESLPYESEPGRAAEIERGEQELTELSRRDKLEEKEPEPKQAEEDEGEGRRFSEVFEQYKRCEACGGKGRRWLIFLCPVCKGLGSVVASSSRREGYYEKNK